jgi:ankyrin repeat protein
MKRVLFFLVGILFTSSLSAMNATQLLRQVQQELQKEKVKERYIDLPQALIQAVQKHDDYEVARLLHTGASPNVLNQWGMPLLNYAIYYGYTRIVDLLLSNGANPNGSEKVIPLHTAVIANQPAIVQLLLKAHADINKQNKEGQTALMLAVEYNHPDIIRLLLQAGADKYKENKYHENAIDLARKKQNTQLIDLLLAASLVFKA